MSEHAEQATVVDWACLMESSYPELALLHAIPNGAKVPYKRIGKGKTFSPEGVKLKREGLKRGVPDLSLPVPRHGYHGLYIEMKYGDNKPTEHQEWWLDRLTEQGFLAVACWGADEAIETICEYLDISQPF